MIVNGGSITCGDTCHNIKLSMGDYQFSTTIYVILMGGVDIVLGLQWLMLFNTFSMTLQELFMSFEVDEKQFQL